MGEGVNTWVVANQGTAATVDVVEGGETRVVANPGSAATVDVTEGRELGPTAFWLLLAKESYEAW